MFYKNITVEFFYHLYLIKVDTKFYNYIVEV